MRSLVNFSRTNGVSWHRGIKAPSAAVNNPPGLADDSPESHEPPRREPISIKGKVSQERLPKRQLCFIGPLVCRVARRGPVAHSSAPAARVAGPCSVPAPVTVSCRQYHRRSLKACVLARASAFSTPMPGRSLARHLLRPQIWSQLGPLRKHLCRARRTISTSAARCLERPYIRCLDISCR